MIDLRALRDDSGYRAGIERKRVREGLVEAVLALDGECRDLRGQVENLRAEQNAASKAVGKAQAADRPGLLENATALKDDLAKREPVLADLESRLRELALTVPNPAHGSVPDGGEDDATELRVVGAAAPAPSLDHAAFGEAAGIVDTVRGARTSGSRFAYITGDAVLLELALVQWVVAKLASQGFTPVVPPVLVREETMEKAGFFPTDLHQVYKAGSAEIAVETDGGDEEADDGLYLVGTSEVPLSVLHAGEVLDAGLLPVRYAGISTCFRREAGTYGKDTKGIFRVHQFDKVEMFSFCDPEKSWDELEALLAIQESIVSGLGLSYRVVKVAAGDLGAPAAMKYDIEAWLPSEGRYRELTSCSNYTDFSARRLDARFKDSQGKRGLLHTLNGTACAIGRTLLFMFEQHQRPDGVMVVPEPLRHWCGFDTIAPKA